MCFYRFKLSRNRSVKACETKACETRCETVNSRLVVSVHLKTHSHFCKAMPIFKRAVKPVPREDLAILGIFKIPTLTLLTRQYSHFYCFFLQICRPLKSFFASIWSLYHWSHWTARLRKVRDIIFVWALILTTLINDTCTMMVHVYR